MLDVFRYLPRMFPHPLGGITGAAVIGPEKVQGKLVSEFNYPRIYTAVM